MSARPRIDRDTRRAQITEVAATVFAQRGVANTAVSDIVSAAGIAQGTFYLYFDSKDDAVAAVVDQVAHHLVSEIEAAAYRPGAGALERLLALRDALSGFEDDPSTIEIADFIHAPENRALHDRLTEHFVPRVMPLVRDIIEQGIAEKVFDVPDPYAAAWFVLAGLQSVELAGTPATRMPEALGTATMLALRALGYEEASA